MPASAPRAPRSTVAVQHALGRAGGARGEQDQRIVVEAAARRVAGPLNWVMQDGKPVGGTATGKGVYTLAAGGAAALARHAF